MRNFVNTIDGIVLDSIKGFCHAHSDKVVLHEDPLYITRHSLDLKKVSLVSGGGSGHEPLHSGFVGVGMLDAACPGKLLTSPTPNQIAAAINAVDYGQGVLVVLKNYHGDKMNFELAKRLVSSDVDMVIVSDDATFDDPSQSRGIAGVLVFQKILGAAAEEGQGVPELKGLAQKVNLQTKSVGVALDSMVPPGMSDPLYDMPDGMMEYGVGIHGEKGKECMPLLDAKRLTRMMVQQVVEKIADVKSKNVLLFVNGLGGAPMVELYIIYEQASQILEEMGFRVIRSLVGNYVTTLSLNGCSITVSVLDEECLAYWDAPVKTPHLQW
ncbi:MAG: dihydroxyacetone kinase subunit DhaK [Arenicella sp.]